MLSDRYRLMEYEATTKVTTPPPSPSFSRRNRLVFAQDSDVNARPIVKADCIKFVYTFRNQFSVEQLLALMPMLIAHLQSEHVSCLVFSPRTP